MKSFYQGKRIFLTGDTGFKGSWLAIWLLELGAEVKGYALPPEQDKSNYNLLGLTNEIEHIDGDIRDYEKLSREVKNFKPDTIFHLAAQPLVGRSYREPRYTFETNVMGTANILDCSRDVSSLASIVCITSDKCYKNKEWLWGYRENDELGGRDPYSASKSAAEMVFLSYCSSFFSEDNSGIGLASTRAGNVIGGGDWSENRIVPDIVRGIYADEEIVLRSPQATRPWQHVLEPLSGYLSLGERLAFDPDKYSGSWNFGPEGRSIRTVGELTEEFIRQYGKGKMKIDPESKSFHEATLLHLNCDKAAQLLDWHPHWDFFETITETVSWYKAYEENDNILQTSLRQIRSYMGGKQ